MDLIVSFGIFIAGMIAALIADVSVIFPLIAGFICFFTAGVIRGHRPAEMIEMAADGVRSSFVVIKLMVIIGCLTAMWRASGTIAFFVYYGIRIITPELFIFICFALTALLSYFLGSSFGVCGTAGVMLMILARSGGVDPVITAGAIMSGAYFGDRTSPASSSAYLTATLTGIGPKKNTAMLLKTGVFPLVITAGIYLLLSVRNPILNIDGSVTEALSADYDISWPAVVPAVLLLVLPWLKMSISNTILISTIASFIAAACIQHVPVNLLGKYLVTGYESSSSALGDIMSGGGIVSMAEVIVVVFISSSFGGMFEGTGMLEPLKEKIGVLADRTGLFAAQVLVSIATIGIFCNQTIGTLLSVQMMGDVYEKKGADREELAADIGNSLITICGMIPWSIACAVPLSMMDAGFEAVPWSVFLWMNPLCFAFTKRLFYRRKK